MKFFKKYIWNKKVIFIFLSFLFLFTFWANHRVKNASKDLIYSDLDSIPTQRVGLLLGTSQFLKTGETNLYFKYRVQAAYDLYASGKIEKILISGDNSKKDYNEPEDMKLALLALGIPENDIHLDFAGFRTLDSVIRAHKVFGQNNFTLISQKFHNERALYIAQRLGLNAVAYNAQDVNINRGFKTQLREKLARVKVFVDFAIGKKPKYLGEAVEI